MKGSSSKPNLPAASRKQMPSGTGNAMPAKKSAMATKKKAMTSAMAKKSATKKKAY